MHAFTEHPIHIARSESIHSGRGWRVRLYRARLSWIAGRPPWASRKPLVAAWRMKLGRRAEIRLPGGRLIRIDAEWLPIPATHERKHGYMCPKCSYTAGRKAFQVPISAIESPLNASSGGYDGDA